MNKILITLLTLSIAGNGYLFFKPKEVIVKESLPEKVVVTETKVVEKKDENIESELKLFQEKLSDAEKEIVRLQAELDLEKERQALAKLSEEVNEANTKKAIKDGEIDRDFAEKMTQERENTKKLFEKEPVDTEWAYQTQDAISKAIHENGDTTLYEIKDLECKTSVCKVSLKPFSNSKGAGMMAGMNASMSFNDDDALKGLKTSFYFDPDNTTEEVEMFISRN